MQHCWYPWYLEIFIRPSLHMHFELPTFVAYVIAMQTYLTKYYLANYNNIKGSTMHTQHSLIAVQPFL